MYDIFIVSGTYICSSKSKKIYISQKKNKRKKYGASYLLPFNVVRAVAAAAILLALPSTFCICVGDSLAANAFSVCNIATGFRDAGQSGRMGATSRCRARYRSYELSRVSADACRTDGRETDTL